MRAKLLQLPLVVTSHAEMTSPLCHYKSDINPHERVITCFYFTYQHIYFWMSFFNGAIVFKLCKENKMFSSHSYFLMPFPWKQDSPLN